jgi:phosphoribosylanthranilate isomerase
MSIQVKICGINSLEAADAAASAGADFAGVVFFPKSPRHVSFEQADAIAAQLRGGPRLVALFVNADDTLLAEGIAAARPDFIQLHGTEAPARVGQIASRFGLPIIKALPVAEGADLEAAKNYEGMVEYFLFDAKSPAKAERPGGHGVSFDWKILSGCSFPHPWLLAGGLNAENVGRAVRASGAEIVDTSSGVETSPGRKSPEMIRAFIQAARNASYRDTA